MKDETVLEFSRVWVNIVSVHETHTLIHTVSTQHGTDHRVKRRSEYHTQTWVRWFEVLRIIFYFTLKCVMLLTKGMICDQSNRPLEKVFICYIYWIEWKALWAHSEQYCVCFLLSVINERGQRGRIVRLFVPWLVLNESIAACLQLSCQADWLCFLLRGVSTTFLNRLFLMHRDIC